MAKDNNCIAAVQFEIKLIFFSFQHSSTPFSDFIYMDLYCNLSKCIGQSPCSFKH